MGLEFDIFLFSWKSDIDENESLTVTQRIKMIKMYYKNRDYDTVIYRALRRDYNLQNSPSTQAIG